MATYNRTPILLNHNAIALIHIFTKYDELEDMWLTDIEEYMDKNYDGYEHAAQQFVAQLEGQWCRKFMYHLRDEIDAAITRELSISNG